MTVKTTELIVENERLITANKRLTAVVHTAHQLRFTLNTTLTQYTGNIFKHFRAMEVALDKLDADG